jgi:hypothetical protein
MGQEPPSATTSKPQLFFIGRDSHNNWVVQDEKHLCGGLFVDRTEALRFAMFENGRRPQAVVMVPGVFELDLSGKASVAVEPKANVPAANIEAPRSRLIPASLLPFPASIAAVPV